MSRLSCVLLDKPAPATVLSMAKHEIALKIEHEIPIGNVDIELPIKLDGSPLGRVKISRGGIDWLRSPRSRTRYTLTWTELAEMMEREGHKKT